MYVHFNYIRPYVKRAVLQSLRATGCSTGGGWENEEYMSQKANKCPEMKDSFGG